jgi:predicted Zn finger-like uncharacterized protein
MKIACESCGAKYSIADEKVQGKVFKIRCKRCSEVIVVRGDGQGGGAGAPAAAASAPAGEAIWHVVINGDQAGPYSPEQLAEMLAGGTVDWDAYVWAEGFDNWVPMRDVETLVSQISGGGSAASAQADARMSFEATPDAFSSAAQPAFGGQPSMGADPFADEPPTTAFGGNIGGEPDLFGGGGRAQATPFDSGAGHVVASSPSPRTAAAAPAAAAAAADSMTGARNENSVLFSLKNLQALATGSGPSMPAAATTASAGYAGGEGSGLIDIRALASATGVGEHDSKDAKDELLSIGNQGAFGALGSPMLAPAHDEDGGSKKMLIWAGVAGFGMLLAAGVAAMFILTRQPAQQAPGIGVATGPVPAPVAPAATQGEQQEELSEGQKAALEAKKAEAEAGGTPTGTSTGSGTRRKPSDKPGEKAPEAEAKPSEPAVEKAPAKPSGPRTIDDLLDGALGPGGTPKPKPAAAPVASNLPDLPSRDDVVSAMGGVKNAVSACAQGQAGTVAFVNVSVAGATGRVTSAEVTGVTGPAGSCIAKAVRSANFPKFAQKVFKVKYPFKL